MQRVFYRLLIAIGFAFPFILTVNAQQANKVVGCLSRAPNGTLLFRSAESGRVFAVDGNLNLLQHYVNHSIAIPYPISGSGNTLTVENIRDIVDTCAAVTPTAQSGTVVGKSGVVQTATPITSAEVANETTAGFQTEAGAIQETGGSAKPPSDHRTGAMKPLLPDQAGQNQLQAETDAEAAARAEMYPGITLAVDLKAAPVSSAASILESNKHLLPGTAK